MIVPNLMVSDMQASIAFYRDLLGFTLVFALDDQRAMHDDPGGKAIVFASLKWGDAEIMLQTVESLAEDLPVFTDTSKPTASGTIFLRGYHPEQVADKDVGAITVKGPVKQWYGMIELYLRDPDGYIICLAAPEGPPPE